MGSHQKHGFRTKANRNNVTYRCWIGMKQRCSNPKATGYKNYGGRGIFYDPRWNKFENFLEDMGLMPSGMSIERINNDGPYCKSNCKWATRKEQNSNQRKRKRMSLTINGISKPIDEWSAISGLSVCAIYGRRKRGIPDDKILEPVSDSRRFITIQGETKRLFEWTNELNISQCALENRIKRWPEEQWKKPPISKHDRLITINGETKRLVDWSREFNVPKSTIFNRLNRGVEGVTLLEKTYAN